ncbi:MAG: MFS transporter [Candidatus Thorarchaeota archaeon]|jgi:MFS family permease
MANLYHAALSIGDLNSEAKKFISRATVLMLVYGFAVMLTNTFLILHALEFVTLTELALILAVQFAIQAIASYPSGAIGDWIGQRWVLFTAALSYAIGFIVLSQAFDFITVLAAFSLVALALSLESGTYIAWFDNNYKLYATEDRNRRTYSQLYGKFTMFHEILTALSFILGGVFLTFIGRQLMFAIQGALMFIVSFMLLRFIRDHKDLKRDKMSVRAYFRYLRGGITTVAQNKTLRLMVLGLMISGAGWAIWGGLILFPFYASYAINDAWTALLRSSIFILGAIGVGIAGMISKRIRRLQRWLALAVLLTDVVFFIGIFIIMMTNPAQSTFVLLSVAIMALSFAISFSPRYLADVLRPRFYLDVIPNENRNAVYSLLPTLTMVVSIFAVPIGGLLIEALGLETTVLVLGMNGLIGSTITSVAIYKHKSALEISAKAIEVCCPIFPSKIMDTQAVVPLSLPCCWSFDPITEYVWSQLRETALDDQVITKEEGVLIDKIVLDIRTYGDVLGKALDDGKIDHEEQEALMEARERIWIEAHNTAMTDEFLSDDAKQILITLTNMLEYIDTKRMFKTLKDKAHG